MKNKLKNYSRNLRWLPVVLLLLASVSCQKAGCSSKKLSDPKTKEATYDAYAEHLPADIEALYLTDNLENVSAIAKDAQKGFAEALSPKEALKETADAIGFNLDDISKTSQAGVNLKHGIAAGSVDYKNTIILFYASDLAKLQKSLVPVWEKAPFDGKKDAKTAVKQLKEGDTTLYISSGDTEGKEIGWFFNGNLVTVVLGEGFSLDSSKHESQKEKRTVEQQLVALAKLKGKSADSLLKYKEGSVFSSFKANVAMPSQFAMYASSESLGPWLAQLIPGAQSDWVKNSFRSVEYIALGGKDSSEQKELVGFVALPLDDSIAFRTMLKSKSTLDLKSFATDETMLVLSTALDSEAIAKVIQASIPEEELVDVKSRLAKTSETIEFDVTNKLFGKLSGDAAVIIYGITGNPMSLMSGGDDAISRGVSAAIMLGFKDEKALSEIVEYARSAMGEFEEKDGKKVPVFNPKGKGTKDDPIVIPKKRMLGLSVVDLEDGKLHRINIRDVPVNIYAMGKNLLITSYAIQPMQAVAFLKGEKPKNPLEKDASLKLARTFLDSPKDDNALYINFNRVKSNLGLLLPLITGGSIPESMQDIKEVLFTLNATESGLLLKVVTDLDAKSVDN